MTESSEQEFYTIPSSSSWFKWDEIHAEEERALPDFFDRSAFSRNPRVYREYRDFIINKFREDPSRRLTFTEVRKSLVGDIGSLWKVFLALERWGLINFGVSGGESLEIAGGDEGPVVVVDDGAPAGVKVVPASGEMGSASLAATATVAGGSGESSFRVPPLTSYTDVFGDWVPKKGPMCGSCSIVCDLGQSESTKENKIKRARELHEKNLQVLSFVGSRVLEPAFCYMSKPEQYKSTSLYTVSLWRSEPNCQDNKDRPTRISIENTRWKPRPTSTVMEICLIIPWWPTSQLVIAWHNNFGTNIYWFE